MIISGIYSITNTINGKIYYGSTNNFYHRWAQHKNNLNNKRHHNSHLQNSWNKYGEISFKFEIVKEVDVEQLLDVEQEYLNKCKENPDLYYNAGYDSEVPTRNPSTKTRLKLRNIQLGRKASLETKEKLRISHLGIKQSKESIIKRSKSLLDKIIYSFYNKNTEERFTGIQSEFRKQYNLPSNGVSDIINNINATYKGWKICH